jgi:anaerobic ribonucleoside-triphosphate reductase activating protein
MITIASWEISTNDSPFMDVSLSIYCSGCHRDCPGCQNSDLQSFKNGILMDSDEVVELVTARISLIESVVFLGGDWMNYTKELKEVSKQIKHLHSNLRLILYTGELIETISNDILENLDIIIDGPYMENQKTNYAIPATSNQRVFFNTMSVIHEIDPSTLPINNEE